MQPPLSASTGFSADEQAEIAWQADILSREFPQRIGLMVLGFSLCVIFVEPALVLALGAINILTEWLNHRITLDPVWRLTRGGYRLQLAMIVVMECAFTSIVGLAWMNDDPFAKAFAVGMVMVTLLHLSSVRSIHLPIGLTGLASVGLTVALFIATYWIAAGNLLGLALTAASTFCALAYTFIAMLSNNRLHRALRMEEARASRADAAKSRFLAVLGHELRTPLNSVLGIGHAAWAETSKPEQRERLALLVAAARDLATILDDATDMSAIVDGRFALRDRPVDPGAELTGALDPFRHAAARQRSDLELRLSPDLPREVCLDPQRFRQCLANLLGNALKHAGVGPIRVTAAPSHGGIGIIVADSGPGIAPEEEERVFEPFQRGRTGAQGSGLGLTISRDLARQMGGDVTLLPTPPGESGARFRLWLPARVPQGPSARPHAADAKAAPDPAQRDLQGRTVLVVDDIATNRLVAAMHLRPARARVIEADSGAAALQALASDHVDLVLLDLNMPGMDGAATLAAIRALGGRHARVPVVAMTADATAAVGGSVAGPGLQGMDGVLVKPLDPDRLVVEVARLLCVQPA